jgi:glycosyltransferase involved in cell wall biosynthesis
MIIVIDARSLEGQKTGVGRYLVNLLEYWKDEKDIRFILYFQNSIPDDEILKSQNFIKKIIKNPIGLKSNAFWQHFTLPANLKKDHPNFFFSPSYLLPFFCPIKSAVTIHDISYEACPEWFSLSNRILLRKMSFCAAKKAEIIFTPSNFSKNEIIKYYKVNPEKIKVTLLGVGESFKKKSAQFLPQDDSAIIQNNYKFDDSKKIKKIKEKYGIKDKFILYIGSIFNRRHLSEIIKAFEKLNLPDYQFLIIGKNHTYPFIDLEKQIQKTNNFLKRNAIIKRNYLSDDNLVWIYNSTSLFVWLSDYEGFGLPILESIACGTPVITNKAGSISEVAGDAAIFVKNPTDSEEINQAIYKGLTDENLRKDLIEKGFQQVKKFSWKKCARETLDCKFPDIAYCFYSVFYCFTD